MKKFVRYLYEYRNGNRVQNVGFVKVETSGNMTGIQIYGKGFPATGSQPLEIFLFYMDGMKCVGIPMGQMRVSGPMASHRMEIPQMKPEINGIILRGERCGYPVWYAGVWDERTVDVERMVLQEEMREEPVEPQERPEPQMPEPRMPEPRMPEPRMPEPQRPEPQMPEPRMPEPQRPEPRMPEPPMPEPQRPEPQRPGPQMPEPQRPGPQRPEPQRPEPQRPEPQMPEPRMPEPRMPEPPMPEPQRPGTQMPEPPMPEPPMPEPRMSEPQRTEPQTEMVSAEVPASQGRTEERRVYKITRQDLAKLPRREWKLANNHFLMHGCRNYHHLISFQKDGACWLGVPGIYHPSEQRAAEAFGFGLFMKMEEGALLLTEEERAQQGEFGYWCRTVSNLIRQ